MDKRIGQLLRTCIWLNLFFFTGQSLAADFEPILSLPPASSEVPLLNETLRDPSLQASKITDDIYAQKTLEEIDALTKELTLAKSSRRLEVLADLYQNYARLSYFYEDVLTGRVAVQDNYGALTQKVKAARSAVNTYANEYSKISKNASGQALYLISVTKFLSDDTNNLELPFSMSKKLTKAQKSRLKLMLALNKIKKNDSSAIQDLSGMRTQMGREGAVAINLVLAKFEASRGHEAYRSYISHATAAAKPLQRPDRERILGFGLRVWKLGEKDKGDWNNVPLNLKLHRDLEITKAIAERSGLQFTDQGKYAPALSFYRSMIESSQGSPRLANVLDRVIELEAAQYQKSKIVGPYQKSLIAGQDILSREGSLGASQTNLAQASSERIRLRHRQLISQLLTTAKQSSTSPKDRIEAINAAKIYLNGSALEAEKIPLSTDIGRVYAINDQHAEAVKIFMELKGQVQGTASQQFLLLAMQSQMVLAKWSPKEAWTLYPVALQKSSRSTLADMYSEKFQFTASWDDLAQLGLLYVNLGQATKAYGLWTAQLAKNTKSESAQLATGMMMNTYKKVRRWQKLEDLARLSIKAQLIPIFQNQRLDAIALLGDALFENGKEQFAASRYPQAISKLAEFTRNYKTDFRRPEGMFVLGQSYHLGNKHTLSVETLFALVTEYPNSSFDHDALLLGGSYSVPMAWEDQTIFFYQKFVDRYSKDSKSPAIRMTLVDLYMGRELYGNAVRAHAAQVIDAQVNRQDQIKSALAIMYIEERFGEAKHAYWGLNKARELSNNNPLILGETLGFEARQAAANSDFNKLRLIETQLSTLNINNRPASEGLALSRLLLADKVAEETKQLIFNLEQMDPYKTLQVQYSIFIKTKTAYEKVCSAGTSIYCGQAMLHLSEITRNSLNAIENLSIAQTLEESAVSRFQKQKLAIITVISQTAAQADSVALGVSEKGETSPEMSQEIVVNNSEGNLDRGHGAIGNGYVQWLPVKTERD